MTEPGLKSGSRLYHLNHYRIPGYDYMNNSDFSSVLGIFTITKYISITYVDDTYGLIKLSPVLSPHLELSSKYFKRE